MSSKNFHRLLAGLLSLFFVGWVVSLIIGHPAGAVISFDEGFHGGTALYLTEVLRSLFRSHSLFGLGYLRGEFNNGIIFYPPLWNAVAGLAGAMFGPSTSLFRLVTSGFGLATGWLVYFFTRQQLNGRPAFLATVVLLTAPLFYLYSHLMMLEVPLAFGTALALLAFYYYLTAENLRWPQLLLVALAFAVGVQGKIIGIAVIYAALGLYGLYLLFFQRASQQRRRFFAWPTGVFLVVALVSWYGYIWAVKHFLHADMLGFFLGQSRGITGSHAGAVGNFLATVWRQKFFYWRDFGHYPILALIWFGSLLGYVIWKRTPLAVFLFCYALGTWIIFSGVAPQEVQYLLAIFVPLAIVTGALVSELIDRLPTISLRQSGLVIAAVGVVWLGGSAVKNSEAQGWRYNVTNQEAIATYIAAHANTGDRVIAWSDSTIYAVRLAGYAKQLQIYNGGDGICANALATATDWAVIEPDGNGSGDQQRDLGLVSNGPWQLAQKYQTSGGVSYLFHNLSAGRRPVVLNAADLAVTNFTRTADHDAHSLAAAALSQSVDEPGIWGCYRLLPLGARTVTFRLKALNLPTGLDRTEPIGRVEVSQSAASTVGRTLTSQDLAATGFVDVALSFDNTKIDSTDELRVWNYQPMTLVVDTIAIH